MHTERWGTARRQSLGMLLNGELIPDRGPRGERIHGGTLLALLHAGGQDTQWRVPVGWGAEWEVILDTAQPEEQEGVRCYREGQELTVVTRSVVLLRRRAPESG